MLVYHTKRTLSLVMSAVLALSLTACSKPTTEDAGVAFPPTSLPQQTQDSSLPDNSETPAPTENETVESQSLPEEDTNYSGVQVGEIIQFGNYDWRVLDVQNSRALIITEKIIENRAYNSAAGIETTWAECSLREYLNNEFYSSFNDTDRQGIVIAENKNPGNPWYGADSGGDTSDYIFLLSLDEVVKYFGDSGQLNSRPSDVSYIDDGFNGVRAARHMGGTFTDSVSGYTHTVNADGAWSWWLRSPGAYHQFATTIAVDGYVIMYGINTHLVDTGVRPALWLDLSTFEIENSTSVQESVVADGITFRDENGKVILNSTHIQSAEAVNSDGENYAVLFSFTEEGSDILTIATSQMIGQTMSLYVNDNPAYSAQIMDAIVNGEIMLGGALTKGDADFMANDIMARLNQ